MKELYEKMINESMAAQRADVGVISENRYKDFKVTDAKAYADAVSNMKALDNQAESVIKLHKNSVASHYKVLTSVTETIRPEDDPFIEHYQTPPVLEILCEEDGEFADSVDKFIDAIADNEALISRESIRRYGGFYGPTCVVDFALMPGSTTNVVNQILAKMDISNMHKQAILSAKSWGMNTSYGVGDAFANAIEDGLTAAEATQKEIETLQMVYREPIEAQGTLMDDADHSSFDVRKYMNGYKKEMTATVKAAMDDGVHYGNIVTVPAYCVGDIGHHIGQASYNMVKDDVTLNIIKATTDVIEATLRSNLDNYKTPANVLNLATGSSACATEYILELDGFNAPMVVDLLNKRFHNYVQQYPRRGAAAELHNCDFMDMIYRGFGAISDARKARSSEKIDLVPKINGFAVDLSPIAENEVIMNPQRYTYPACAITVRFSSLMRLADYPCLLTSEPITATMMTNIIALNKESAGSPARGCKNCASATLVDGKHEYCQWREAI
ncbi:DUF2193 domain-containing protein [Methanobrevibacter millerae]|jgi:hypothetical protein|uniref:DUF2193 domain-containing protein n=1 Tax=Methanobrevibacter millerae TaxID=230361 RepID=A0A0U2TSF7_9EURY|nr:DUF2193 domain-containing protein [Methanobrevibacter millerae]ALT68819.1 hypothetical protein sm9_1030 [Methanobrevibacter millerae]